MFYIWHTHHFISRVCSVSHFHRGDSWIDAMARGFANPRNRDAENNFQPMLCNALCTHTHHISSVGMVGLFHLFAAMAAVKLLLKESFAFLKFHTRNGCFVFNSFVFSFFLACCEKVQKRIMFAMQLMR